MAKNYRQRSRFNTALILLLAITRTVGSNAGALPATRFFNKESVVPPTPQSCVANMKRPNGQCLLARGGASAAAAAASSTASSPDVIESLRVLGLAGALLSMRESVSESLSAFWANAERTKFLLAGAVAGIVSRTAVSPLEVVATAQMVRGGNKNMMSELTELFQSEGIKGFFKGNGANCLKVAPTRGVQFFAFESFKKRLVVWKRVSMGLPEDADVALTPLERLVAGGCAGMIASSMVYPIEVVKTMLTMYPGKYAGINAAFRGVLAEVGPKGLYAGLQPTLIAMFPYVGVEFMIYETAKIAVEAFMKRKAGIDENSEEGMNFAVPIIISLGLGALAGAAAQTSAHPLDVVRKRLQIQGINGNPVLYRNTFDAFSGIIKKEGFKTVYKGLGPACVATIPGTGIAYITYEFMKRYLQISSL